jgi:hypothetical protein
MALVRRVLQGLEYADGTPSARSLDHSAWLGENGALIGPRYYTTDENLTKNVYLVGPPHHCYGSIADGLPCLRWNHHGSFSSLEMAHSGLATTISNGCSTAQ